MKTYIHTVTDQVSSFNMRNFGISTTEYGTVYKKTMDWINEHQEWRGGERYEYLRTEYDLRFVWKLDEEGFSKIQHDVQSPDVFGAVHFGRMMVEFRCNGGGFDDEHHDCTNDMYVYGNAEEGIELWIGDHTPYHILDDDLPVPKRRTMDGFKRAVEQNILDYLNEHPNMIKYVISPTIVDEWY